MTSRDTFLREYELKIGKDFEFESRRAQWAIGTTGPRFWGQEDAVIELTTDNPSEGNAPSASAALSPDEKFLAVAANAVIRIYDVVSRSLCADLVGHQNSVHRLYFAPVTYAEADYSYLLLSQGSEVKGEEGKIIVWPLDRDCRPIAFVRTMPFAIEDMADKSLNAIAEDLHMHHDLADDDVRNIRSGFLDVLKDADTKNRARQLFTMDGQLPGMNSRPISHDGKRMISVIHGKSTQSGMRPPDKLPQILVLDIDTRKEICRLSGHTDTIPWVSWSPVDKIIATASWDGTFKLWDAVTGSCRHTIGPTGGQNRTGSFSADGTLICLSGGRPVDISVYHVATGDKVVTFSPPEGIRPDARHLNWHPTDKVIALVCDHSILIWELFPEKVHEIFSIAKVASRFDAFSSCSRVHWADEGSKLLVCSKDLTIFVCDIRQNAKWRFQRPKGTMMATTIPEMMYLTRQRTVVSVDGDRKVRFWNL